MTSVQPQTPIEHPSRSADAALITAPAAWASSITCIFLTLISVVGVWRDSITYHLLVQRHLGDFTVLMWPALDPLRWRLSALQILSAFVCGYAISVRNRRPRWLAIGAVLIASAGAITTIVISP